SSDHLSHTFSIPTAHPLTATYTLSLHDALPIFRTMNSSAAQLSNASAAPAAPPRQSYLTAGYSARSWLLTVDHKRIAILYLISIDRKSTRLNSSHVKTSYAVFCLKKKTKNKR